MHRRTTQLDARLLSAAVAWAAVAYGIHRAGVAAGWYGALPWFQNLTHAASASGVAVLVGVVALHAGVEGRRLLAVAVGLTALGALGWEAVEYMGWLDAYGWYLHFHGFEDAAVDMASNAVGTVVALAALWWQTGLTAVEGGATGS